MVETGEVVGDRVQRPLEMLREQTSLDDGDEVSQLAGRLAMGQLVRVKTGAVQPGGVDLAVREGEKAREGRNPVVMDVDPDCHDLSNELQQVVRDSVVELVRETEVSCMTSG